MENSLYFVLLFVFFAIFLLWVFMTHGLSGRFLYTDKRKKDVTLHLAIFGTPRGKGAARKVIDSLECCLQNLKRAGYVSVTFESHLIDQKKMKMVQRIANIYGYKVINVSVFPTPRGQKFFIPFSMTLLRFKHVHVNPSSTKLTIVL